ncbi:MAG: hypothetical protein QXP72_04815 [Desulfurococcaceae archaeon]
MSENFVIGDFLIENSRSRSGRHIAVSTLVLYSKSLGVIPLSKASEFIIEEKITKPTYVKGAGRRIKIRVRKGDFVIYGWFVKNFLNRVKGFITVYNYRGEAVYRVKYNDGVIRRSFGDPIYDWLIKIFIDTNRVVVKEYKNGGKT